jgi:hypothetical protein
MKTVTLGMFTVGILILTGRLSWWWFKSGKSRDWKGLIPFAMSTIAFAAAGAAAGGILGYILGGIRYGLGWFGDQVLTKGAGAEQVSVTRSAEFGTLNPFGAVVMLILLVLSVVVWKTAKRKPKKEITWGAPCGLTLGPFLGAVTLTPLLNQIGIEAISKFFGAS